jgi:hypothetical protein
MDLMRRPEGCSVREAAITLNITPAGARGMIRDLRRLVSVETIYGTHGGRGKGQRAIHYMRTALPSE